MNDDICCDVPEYYQIGFKGRPVKFCPVCKSKVEYDGWSVEVETRKLVAWWFCKKCKKLYKDL